MKTVRFLVRHPYGGHYRKPGFVMDMPNQHAEVLILLNKVERYKAPKAAPVVEKVTKPEPPKPRTRTQSPQSTATPKKEVEKKSVEKKEPESKEEEKSVEPSSKSNETPPSRDNTYQTRDMKAE